MPMVEAATVQYIEKTTRQQTSVSAKDSNRHLWIHININGSLMNYNDNIVTVYDTEFN